MIPQTCPYEVRTGPRVDGACSAFLVLSLRSQAQAVHLPAVYPPVPLLRFQLFLCPSFPLGRPPVHADVSSVAECLCIQAASVC